MRRAIDIVVSILCLVLLLPIFLLVAILIKLDSAGLVLYTPRMVGHDGKSFSLYRFRTMSDGRLTRIGTFLRHYSIDHLPMLINLLRGDLTLIGPRPMEVHLVNLQDSTWQRYFEAKPGIFNYAVLKLGRLWTPSRASHPTLNQELELEYLQKRSLKEDWKLFLDSLHSLIKSRGNIKARGDVDREMDDRLRRHSS